MMHHRQNGDDNHIAVPSWAGAEDEYDKVDTWISRELADRYAQAQAGGAPFRMPRHVGRMLKALTSGDERAVRILNRRYFDRVLGLGRRGGVQAVGQCEE